MGIHNRSSQVANRDSDVHRDERRRHEYMFPLERANITDSQTIMIPILWAWHTTLVSRWALCILPGVNCWTIRQQGMCAGGTAIVLQRSQQGVSVGQRAVGRIKVTGTIGVDIIDAIDDDAGAVISNWA